jgi:hypothetical protein
VLNAAKFSLNEESFARFLKIVGSNIAQGYSLANSNCYVLVGKIRLHIGYIFKDNKKGLQIFVCNPLILMVGRQGLEPWTHGHIVYCPFVSIHLKMPYKNDALQLWGTHGTFKNKKTLKLAIF